MAFSIAVDGHLAILADLERNAIPRRKRGGAGSRALGGGSPPASLDDAAVAGQLVRATRNERRFTCGGHYRY